MAFADESTETLLAARANLLRGLDLVAQSIEDGTFDDVGPGGKAPPSESGALTLLLLLGVENELTRRNP